ncbi:lactate utilization protein [Maridesulfovibrio bastinii]|uniref:lactate utilization protein n=1 Tax=Maridesulfovibrio bastinii TaxID=47157 RepID=UPI0003F788E1|nr:lactate utilization protein [Maridesulfovibrio bastinii]
MAVSKKIIDTFKEKAELVSAVVTEVKSIDEALQYTVDLCDKKEACKLLISGCEENLSEKAGDLCDLKAGKIISAPALDKKTYTKFTKLCDERGFSLISEGMRNHLAGIDIGFTYVDHAIAETGTLVLNSCSEELRLATMVSEIHVAVLPVSKIKETSYEVEKAVEDDMRKGPNYTAFITGASRTSDIERVLTIGVHGPLELHILLLED